MGHPVIHAEIRSTDPDATREFFSALFGWTYSAGAFPGYTFADTGGKTALPTAIGPLQGGEDAVLFFVGVDDPRRRSSAQRNSAAESSNPLSTCPA